MNWDVVCWKSHESKNIIIIYNIYILYVIKSIIKNRKWCCIFIDNFLKFFK